MLAKVLRVELTQCQHSNGETVTLGAIINHVELAQYL